MTDNVQVSVLICTRNRAEELQVCLAALLPRVQDFSDVEVVVVDNGSTDDTKEIVDAIGNYPVRYIVEPIAGLCQARNRGRLEARGSVLAYIDDDVIVGDEWIRRIRQHFVEKKSDCLGGRVTATLDGDLPFQMDESMLWFFQATSYGDRPRELTYPEHPIGCNMAFFTNVFDAVGGFNTALRLYGDETDFFRRVEVKGFNVMYDPAIIVDQIIPAERLTKEAIKEKSYNWGLGSATLWRLGNPAAFTRFGRIIRYSFFIAYLGIAMSVRPTFGRYFTYWYDRGYLAKLLNGSI